MTKQLIFCIGLVAAFFSTAHGQFRFGVGGGMNASATLQRSVSSDARTLEAPMLSSQAAIVMLWQRPSGFYLRSGLSLRNISNADQLFWYEWAFIPQPLFGFNRKTWYVQAPLQAGYSWKCFRISSGPYAGLRVFETHEFFSPISFAISPAPTQRWDFGWSGTVGIDMEGLSFQVEYLRGLRSISGERYRAQGLFEFPRYNNFLSASVLYWLR